MRGHLEILMVALVAFAVGGGALCAQENPSVVPPGEFLAAVLPVVGSTPGDFGSYFKTAVQIHNPTTSTFAYRLVFHPAGRSGSPGDPSYAGSIAPFRTEYFPDMLPAMGVGSGLGSLDVFIAFGTQAVPVTTVRVFNDEGAAGTSGFTEGFVGAHDALGVGQDGYLVCPPDLSAYRFNVGVRTLGQGATLSLTVRNQAGVVTKTLTKTYDPDFFEQTSVSAFLEGAALSGSDCIQIHVTNGAAAVYGATADNRTNDPSYQLAESLVD